MWSGAHAVAVPSALTPTSEPTSPPELPEAPEPTAAGPSPSGTPGLADLERALGSAGAGGAAEEQRAEAEAERARARVYSAKQTLEQAEMASRGYANNIKRFEEGDVTTAERNEQTTTVMANDLLVDYKKKLLNETWLAAQDAVYKHTHDFLELIRFCMAVFYGDAAADNGLPQPAGRELNLHELAMRQFGEYPTQAVANAKKATADAETAKDGLRNMKSDTHYANEEALARQGLADAAAESERAQAALANIKKTP